MGDRYSLNLYCAACGIENEDIYYAESCEATTFKCEHCGKENEIYMKFDTKIKD